jgi:hypothetical protein
MRHIEMNFSMDQYDQNVSQYLVTDRGMHIVDKFLESKDAIHTQDSFRDVTNKNKKDIMLHDYYNADTNQLYPAAKRILYMPQQQLFDYSLLFYQHGLAQDPHDKDGNPLTLAQFDMGRSFPEGLYPYITRMPVAAETHVLSNVLSLTYKTQGKQKAPSFADGEYIHDPILDRRHASYLHFVDHSLVDMQHFMGGKNRNVQNKTLKEYNEMLGYFNSAITWGLPKQNNKITLNIH